MPHVATKVAIHFDKLLLATSFRVHFDVGVGVIFVDRIMLNCMQINAVEIEGLAAKRLYQYLTNFCKLR